jgi:hypothetical protein
VDGAAPGLLQRRREPLDFRVTHGLVAAGSSRRARYARVVAVSALRAV